MSSSDDEGEFFPSCVTDFELVNQANEHVSLACLPLHLQKNEVVGIGQMQIFVSGSCDDGLQKIYKEVVAWRYELSYAQPEISVLCKGNYWVKILKPKRVYETSFRSTLITVHCLHFVKHNQVALEESIWSHLSRVFSNYEIGPSEEDFMTHLPLVKDAAECDQTLKDSEFIQRILSGQPLQRKVPQVGGIPEKRQEFIVDEDTNDPCEDDEDSELEDELFDSCCSFCDNGGDILCCEGRCMRSFHPSKQIGDFGEETCEGLGLSEVQIKNIAHFFCQNCQQQRHQCFICGKLGSSDVTSSAEVFPCVNGNCGRFYHPKCVSRELQQLDDNPMEDLEKRIAAGESFVCPSHRCFSCKKVEDRTVHEMQFAVCRRCPKSYHRKCLPREIIFSTGNEMGILPRAWDDLLPKRILIYCLGHEIDPSLGTPLRNHISFPIVVKVKMPALEKPLTGLNIMEKKRKLDQTASGNTKKQVASEPARLVDKQLYPPSFESRKKAYSSKLTHESTAHAKHLSKPFSSSSVIRGDSPRRISKVNSEIKKSINLYNEKLIPLHSTKPLASPVADIEMERRVNALMEKVNSSFNVEEFMKHHKISSMYNKNSKDVIDKNLTKGKVETTVKAIREALQKLDNGCSIDDAKAVCSPEMLRQLPIWKNKLKLYIAPFIHGMHYSSFGRHFTKSEKLQEIVNKLHHYVCDGDMIVDFCCGANEFSCLMKEKLDSVGKKRCSFKNYDLFPTKNDFNFEQRDWFTVNPRDLPLGSQLVIGLNPPFGYKASLANKFINKALQFKPKLLILIVPPETQRLDSWNKNKKNLKYDLLWENQYLLSGNSFYLPGAFDANEEQISQWNNTTPPLYLWSHPDWTRKHRKIADCCGHSEPLDKLPPNYQPPSSKNLQESRKDNAHGDLMNVYGNLPNFVDDVPGRMDYRDLNYNLDGNLGTPSIYGPNMRNVYGHQMSNAYGHHQISNAYGQHPMSNAYGQLPMSNVYGHHQTSDVYNHDMSNVYGHHQTSDVYNHDMSNVYGQQTSNVYGHQASNVYHIDPVIDKHSTTPSVENPGPLYMGGQMGRSGMDAKLRGRENFMDMEISPKRYP